MSAKVLEASEGLTWNKEIVCNQIGVCKKIFRRDHFHIERYGG